MARIQGIQTNFTGGEMSPRLFSRVDFNKYRNGLETCANAHVTPQGPVIRRNGSKYIADANHATQQSWLIPFSISETANIMLEFADDVIRFFTNDANGNPGIIEACGCPVELVSPYGEEELKDLQWAQFGNAIYLAHPSYAPRKLIRDSNTVWTIEEVDFRPPPTYEDGYTNAGSITLSATTGSSVTATASANTFKAADVGRQLLDMKGSGRGVITAVASATSATVNVIQAFDGTATMPSGGSATDPEWILDLSPFSTLSFSTMELGEEVTVTSDTAAFWEADVENERFIIAHNGVIRILSYTSDTVLVGVVEKQLDVDDDTVNWTLERRIWNSTFGFPRTVSLFQQRLWFAGTTFRPQTVWGSQSNQLENFGVGSEAAAALEFEILSEQANLINFVSPIRELLIGTQGSEHTLGSTSGAITPGSASQRPRTSHGCRHRQVARPRGEIAFIQKGGRKIRVLRYDFNIDSYTGDDLLFLANHLTETYDLDQISYADDPDSVLYALRTDGVVLACTYDRGQNVTGWSTIDVGGTVKSIATMNFEDRDQLWMVVQRTVDGNTVQYIEVMQPQQPDDDTASFQDSYLVYSDPKTISGITKANPGVVTATSHGYSNGDSVILKDVGGMTEVNGNTYTIANVSTHTFELSGVDTQGFTTYTSGGEAHKKVSSVSGLTHLEGETVQVRGDGAVQNEQTVSSGSITLEYDAGEVIVGLGYTTTIKTLRLETGEIGALQGQQSRWVNPIVRVYKSYTPTVNGNTRPNRMPADPMGAQVPVFTGDLFYSNLGWGTTGQLTIVQSDPVPLTVQGIFGSVEANSK